MSGISYGSIDTSDKKLKTRHYEYESFPGSERDRENGWSTILNNRKILVGLALLCTIVLAAVRLSAIKNNVFPKSPSFYVWKAYGDVHNAMTVQRGTTSDAIDYEIARDGYDPLVLDDEYLRYVKFDPYSGIIEPHAAMNLVVNGMNESEVYYRWALCPTSDPNVNLCHYGLLAPTDYPSPSTSVTITCEAYETYTLYVSEFSMTDDSTLRVTSGYAICLYVRREIRTLTDTDLDATMDAMYALWEYEQTEGQEKYGTDFNTASLLLKFHHFNSAWQEADHIHEGLGFLLQHIKMSNIFEKSMQSVDPSVSLPYWDFTIESANGTALWESPIFSPDVFGSMPNVTDSYWGFTYANDDVEAAAIPDGRWAFTEADWNDEYPDLLYGYGYMRAPWSMNPSPYVSRFTSDWQIGTTLPRCSSHYQMLSYTDLMDFLMDAGDDPHSSAHSLVGGLYGCDMLLPLLAKGYISSRDDMMTICGKWSFIVKELFRNDLLTPYTNCSTTDEECGFECADDTGDIQYLVKELISSSVPDTLSQAGWTAWVDFICTGDGWLIFPGDHLESASPTDPSFWPIHPTLERLLHVKFMSGGFENTTWHDDAETQSVCHHASCYEEKMNATGFWLDCCYGHFQYDQMMNAITGHKEEHWGQTNDDVLNAADPTSVQYAMPYIYDKFDWSHCLAVDVDFDEMLDGFYSQYVGGDDDDRDDNPILNITTDDSTHEPTYEPTDEPTAAPSLSAKPTRSPDTTHAPTTAAPTLVPSPKPTRSPDSTHPPTFQPTYKPTRSPDATHPPTFNPTTSKPTRSPDATHAPTEKPTRSPDATHAPTVSPSLYPTLTIFEIFEEEPTATPTKHQHSSSSSLDSPDLSPTSLPTKRSQLYMTSDPTIEPTFAPSLSPSYKPTLTPTPEPSLADVQKMQMGGGGGGGGGFGGMAGLSGSTVTQAPVMSPSEVLAAELLETLEGNTELEDTLKSSTPKSGAGRIRSRQKRRTLR